MRINIAPVFIVMPINTTVNKKTKDATKIFIVNKTFISFTRQMNFERMKLMFVKNPEGCWHAAVT